MTTGMKNKRERCILKNKYNKSSTSAVIDVKH